MDETSIFGLDPDQLDQLFSLGTEGEDDTGADLGKTAPGPSGAEARTTDSSRFTTALESSLERVGQCLGPYRLVSVLGEGGMGIVYFAEQEYPIQRQVALKVIKPGMDSKRVTARFEAERQALALLDHPNIAHVYEAGTTDGGRPYFVMEYVEGRPITEYCDREKLTVEDRLRLFQQVCLAVHHAHQKGIIHRDLKPSNIIVSAENDRPTPKIIDFGVAKAMRQPLTERTLVTEDSHLLGTPEYMSPEQADMAKEDVDTRSDIYSLGVLLYVLLTGVLPFDSDTLRTGGIAHIREVIRATDPKTPSTRLTKLGEEAQKLAESRRTDVVTLARCLHRELERIPLKAMRKDRAERYRSAAELADDIANYLKGAPLIAGPPGTGYRLKKFMRRNRVWVGAISAVLVVLVAGVVVSTVFAVGQARARVEADNARTEAELIADFLENDVLGSAGKARVGEATVGYILRAASQSLEGKFKDKPLIEASIRLKLGYTARQIGESDEAEQHFLRAIDIYTQHYGEEHLITLNTMDYLGYIYGDQGRYRDMERLWSRILEIRQRVYGVEYPASTINGLAGALSSLGKYDEAESLFKKALESEEGWYEVAGEDFKMSSYLKCNLAGVYAMMGRYEEAEPLLCENIDDTRGSDISGMDAKYGVNLRYSTVLADLYRKWGRYGKAEPLFEKNLQALREIKGDEHNLTINCMCGLVQLYVDQDRYEEAETLFGEVLPIARRRLRKDHRVTLSLVNTLAVLRTKQKQYSEAERLFDEAWKSRQRELGDDHPETLETINDLGILRRKQGQYDQAESLLLQAWHGRQRKLGNDHPACFESMHELAVLYLRQARYEDAEPLLLDAFHGREAKLGPEHPHTIDSLKQLVTLYESWPDPAEAARWQSRLVQTHAVEE
jgi:serine/threonine protein kinase/Flp pilus assembly protein TadD